MRRIGLLWSRSRRRGRFGAWDDIVLFPQVQLAYVTVPKTGNTTVKMLLAKALELLSDEHRALLGEDPQQIHQVLRSLPGMRLDESNPAPVEDYTAFATVRHPVDRFESFYRDKIACAGWDAGVQAQIFDAYGFTGRESIDECLEKVVSIPDEEAEIHFRSQSAIIDASPWEKVRTYRMEALEELWEWLSGRCRQYGFDLSQERPRFNATPEESRRGLSASSIALLQQRYAADFKRFGYPFESEVVG